MSDEEETIRKQKRRKKRIKKTPPVTKLPDNEENLEAEEEKEEGIHGTSHGEGLEVAAETKNKQLHHSTPHRQHRRHSSSSSRQSEKRLFPHTVITAVLEELNDDMVDEPPRSDAGENMMMDVTAASLPQDKVYIERKNGFATTPRAKMFHSLNSVENGLGEEHSKSLATPLELAIFIQKCCCPIYTLCHGLLGGMALLHLILVYSGVDQEGNFMHTYTHYARVYQSLFHILSILCFISIMDRCDVQHMDLNQLGNLFHSHFSTVMVLICYFVTLVLTFVTLKWDDWLALVSYNDSKEYLQDTDKLTVWKNLNLCRSIGAIIGWILIALFPAEDMLHDHLCSMIKYQPTISRSGPPRY